MDIKQYEVQSMPAVYHVMSCSLLNTNQIKNMNILKKEK